MAKWPALTDMLKGSKEEAQKSTVLARRWPLSKQRWRGLLLLLCFTLRLFETDYGYTIRADLNSWSSCLCPWLLELQTYATSPSINVLPYSSTPPQKVHNLFLSDEAISYTLFVGQRYKGTEAPRCMITVLGFYQQNTWCGPGDQMHRIPSSYWNMSPWEFQVLRRQVSQRSRS